MLVQRPTDGARRHPEPLTNLCQGEPVEIEAARRLGPVLGETELPQFDPRTDEMPYDSLAVRAGPRC